MAITSEEHDPACSLDLSPAIALFRGLGDSSRLAILHELARGEWRIADLTVKLGLAQSTVSAHLGCLRDCGLVEGQVVGGQVFYRLTCPELLTVLGAAERVLAATGNAVASCPAYGDTGLFGHQRPAGPHSARGLPPRLRAGRAPSEQQAGVYTG